MSPVPGSAGNKGPKIVSSTSSSVPTKLAATDKDIYGPPQSPGTSSDEDDLARTANIMPTNFRKRASEQPDRASSKNKSARGSKLGQVTVNGARAEKNTRSSPRRKEIASSQSSDLSSPKRKCQELGTGMVDSFGRVQFKKPRTKPTFRSSQSSQSGTPTYGGKAKDVLSAAFKSSSMPEESSDDSPKKSFRAISTLTDFESPEKSGAEDRKLFKYSDVPGTPSTPGSSKRFIASTLTPSPLKRSETPGALFKVPSLDDLFTDELLGPAPGQPSPTRTKRSRRKPKVEEMPLTQLPSFKIHSEIDELVGPIRTEDNADRPPVLTSLLESDDFANQTQKPRCPMCNELVDPTDLEELSHMNTRKQEQFCLSHQRKTARATCKAQGYPEIDWKSLDSRIAKHRSFIKDLINGGESHYRTMLDEKVQTGKDRNLLQMTSNLTPGYYGTRGLRVMSENIMHDFTPLLKKRVVKDRLMAARGVAGFVESVVVPEVAVLLIKEDMSVGSGEARDILADSASLGELIHEEVRDIVKRRIEDSEEDDDF
ncbi:uncharacterized protein BP5553_07828 [Venustampulla echinocandica]|uniref:Restriction of telomere capping protein 4 n=1 Tax=Venustampulla echinocandica TaxID=2656787 RepID=A0A370THP4_9HELO|nr:uncharacterized protein BP5553_07828 [Venustampulla echinocandica]RDL34700.1 hypothetical protein BP5553_07828 [Venustampulla echinocandica]